MSSTYRVTIKMAGKVGLQARPQHFDELIGAAQSRLERRNNGPRRELTLPITRTEIANDNEKWVYKASEIFFKLGEEIKVFKAQKTPKGQVPGGKGYKCLEATAWVATDNIGELKKLAAQIRNIGLGFRDGFGEVISMDFELAETEEQDNWNFRYMHKPVPSSIPVMANIKPPYWREMGKTIAYYRIDEPVGL
ncbi:hypothetical protein [Vibrio barjaei]|uniref:hypothetical protein n=1 Tax=Vibrio barjaei TaxID=1676683 RepID=UPI00228536E2|nr:hypothetical protein [Vibrio barjaei]MCY9870489.1 hypothetical protein [Vibrio barjaei]